MDAYFDLKNKEVNGEAPKDDKDNKTKIKMMNKVVKAHYMKR